jgi:hypothetical protein
MYDFFSQFLSELIKRQYLLLEKKFNCFNVLLTTYYFSLADDSEQITKMIYVAVFYVFFFIVTVNVAYSGTKYL